MTVTVAVTTLFFEATASRGTGNQHGSTGQTLQALPFTGTSSNINHASGAGVLNGQLVPGDNIVSNAGGLAECAGVIPPASLVTGVGYTGGQGDSTFLPVTGAGTASNEAHATLAGVLLNVTCAGHALTGGVASSPSDHPLTFDPVEGVGYCGAIGGGSLLPVIGSGMGIPTGIIGIGAGVMVPVWGVGFASNPGGANTAKGAAILLPVAGQSGNGYAAAMLPHVFGRGYAVNGSVAIRTQWAMNIENNAITEWNNVEFYQIARAFNNYWAVGIDGNLYQWGGDTDNLLPMTSTPIAWSFQTGLSDLGSRGVKGLLGIYLDGIFEPNINFTLQTDRGEYTYTFKVRGNPEDHETQRISLGRGIRTANVGFGLSSVVGGYFELDTMTPEYVLSNRNLGTK